MKFSRPAWVGHHDTSKESTSSAQKRPPIYSVHVHPDNSRIATGGMDTKVRVWSTKPILQAAAEESGRPPKSLCTLTMHTGPVLTVRWAHSGRWLASGSDDTVIMIWDLDPAGGGKVWGSNEVNIEGWKALKRLIGHDSDVTDLAWAPEDRYLASVGLDSAVFIWCGYTLERLHRIDQHKGFVKGVCWDPVGQYLATSSDDRSVKIWHTGDWRLEAEVTKPFDDSPGSTFFRRLSWSPDGAHITTSNATNNKGFVFIAAVITRDQWTSDISLVGHENTVEVTAYNPHMFLRDASGAVSPSNVCSIVALGSDDCSVSIWQTKSARPLIVAKAVFERSVMDLAWSRDGMTLYAVSSDGTMGVFHFNKEEMYGLTPFDVQQQYLKRFNFDAPPLPSKFVPAPDEPSQPSGLPGKTTSQTEVVNKLVAKRKPKAGAPRRAALMSHVPSSSVPSSAPKPNSSSRQPGGSGLGGEVPRPSQIGVRMSPKSSILTSESATKFAMKDNMGPIFPPRSGTITTDGFGFGDINLTSNLHAALSSGKPDFAHLDTSSPDPKRKRRSTLDLSADGPPPPARTLGGDRPWEAVAVRELASGFSVGGGSGIAGSSHSTELPVPPLLTSLTKTVSSESNDPVLEARNPEDGGPSEVQFVLLKQTQWLDYVQSPVLSLAVSNHFCAVALQDGSIIAYSHTGRRLMPTLSLGVPVSYLAAAEQHLMAITAGGMLYVWNIKKASVAFSPTSLQPLMGTPNSMITSTSLRPNGTPFIHLSNGSAYTYDPDLSTFVKLSDKWWMSGSDAWTGRQRGSSSSASRGAVAVLEQQVAEGARDDEVSRAGKQRPEWWEAALTLGHLETRMHAAQLLDSPVEYKQALLAYATRLSSEGFRGKAEELLKELFGPIYWRPGMADAWVPTVLGFTKRDLMREVLSVFARGQSLRKLAQDWQELLRKSTAQD